MKNTQKDLERAKKLLNDNVVPRNQREAEILADYRACVRFSMNQSAADVMFLSGTKRASSQRRK